jgi:hypothetical protein
MVLLSHTGTERAVTVKDAQALANPLRLRRALNEIARANPLLFDFVLKRSLRDPATGRGLPASAFLANPALPPTVLAVRKAF